MKAIITVVIFLMVSFITLNAQDKQQVVKKEIILPVQKSHEENCPHCQGWGWVISLTYKFGNTISRTSGSDALLNNRYNNNIITMQQRVKCYYCGGTGKIWIKSEK